MPDEAGRVEYGNSSADIRRNAAASGLDGRGSMLIERGSFEDMSAAFPDNRSIAAHSAIPSRSRDQRAIFDAQGWSIRAGTRGFVGAQGSRPKLEGAS